MNFLALVTILYSPIANSTLPTNTSTDDPAYLILPVLADVPTRPSDISLPVQINMSGILLAQIIPFVILAALGLLSCLYLFPVRRHLPINQLPRARAVLWRTGVLVNLVPRTIVNEGIHPDRCMICIGIADIQMMNLLICPRCRHTFHAECVERLQGTAADQSICILCADPVHWDFIGPILTRINYEEDADAL